MVFSLFDMIPMGESSALYLVNKYNLEIEHAAQMDYSERLKVYQAIPSDKNWKTIEPLFSIKVNRPYLDYTKSATGDKESINRAVQDFQSVDFLPTIKGGDSYCSFPTTSVGSCC